MALFEALPGSGTLAYIRIPCIVARKGTADEGRCSGGGVVAMLHY